MIDENPSKKKLAALALVKALKYIILLASLILIIGLMSLCILGLNMYNEGMEGLEALVEQEVLPSSVMLHLQNALKGLFIIGGMAMIISVLTWSKTRKRH